jgi:glycosyltransferase involved in cell wall biosynthesis
MQPWVIIPVYNEQDVVADVIQELKKAGYHNLLVVDDGSRDNSRDAAEAAGAVAIRHAINRGKGAAVKTGVEACKVLDAEAVVTMDGDGQHNPADIRNLLLFLERGYDVVLGVRSFGSKEIPLYKTWANYVGNLITWIAYGLWVRDSQSGFRAYSRRAIDLIETRTDRYEYDSEVIRELKRHRLRFIEVPIKVRYTDYSQKKAHRQNLTNGIKTVIKMLMSD